VTSQLLVPFLANVIRREEKRAIKRFSLDFAMSTDASLGLGASPVSPVRASESTNVMVVEDSRDHVHVHFPVRTQHVPIISTSPSAPNMCPLSASCGTVFAPLGRRAPHPPDVRPEPHPDGYGRGRAWSDSRCQCPGDGHGPARLSGPTPTRRRRVRIPSPPFRFWETVEASIGRFKRTIESERERSQAPGGGERSQVEASERR
jgi:hypothetical protein